MAEQLCLLPGDRPITGHALLSEDRVYRYALWREWEPKLERVLFVMLNPSTADERENDATIRKCIAFAKRWGLGGLSVGNLYAFRSREPKELLVTLDPIGPLNDEQLGRLVSEAKFVICAWGKGPGGRAGPAARLPLESHTVRARHQRRLHAVTPAVPAADLATHPVGGAGEWLR